MSCLNPALSKPLGVPRTLPANKSPFIRSQKEAERDASGLIENIMSAPKMIQERPWHEHTAPRAKRPHGEAERHEADGCLPTAQSGRMDPGPGASGFSTGLSGR